MNPFLISYIIDSTRADFTPDDHMVGATLATRQYAVFQNPNVREAIIVTSSQVASMAAKGLNSPVFGHIKLHVFKTLDAALDYARSAL